MIEEGAGTPVDFRKTDLAFVSKRQLRAFIALSSDYLVEESILGDQSFEIQL